MTNLIRKLLRHIEARYVHDIEEKLESQNPLVKVAQVRKIKDHTHVIKGTFD